MFMVTLGDVFGIIIFLALVGYLVYFFVSGRKATKFVNDQKSAKREEAPKKATPRAAGVLELLGIIVFIAVCLIVSALSKK